jgi:hypothetical protein
MLQARGRSRQVSNTALARQASEERRSSQPNIISPIPVKAARPPSFRSSSPSPPSSASMSPDYDLPASPPRSLEDQVHVAYALDDIHLAKILLLRLKGIEVTSDDDPRIAAVQDEDFDFCFVPNGRLMDDTDEKAIKDMQTKELERMEERRRFDRLRICEKFWEDQKRRFREERLAVFRLRERKWMEEEDRRRTAEQQQKERHRIQRAAEKAVQRTRARLVCYDNHPPTSEKRAGQQFVYDVMIHSTSSSPTRFSSPTISHSKSKFRPPVFDDSRSIPFTAVLESMQGSLFPASSEDSGNSPSTSKSTSIARTHDQRRLLDALLIEIKWTEEELRNRKGKQKVHFRTSLPCLACSIASPSTSHTSSTASSSSSVSRASSWLSFAASTSSSPTDPITPPTSPSPSTSSRTGWFKSSVAPRPKSWIITSNNNPRLRHSCNLHSRFTPVSSSESPLPLNPTHPTYPTPMSYHGRGRSTSTVRAAREGAGLLVRRMSRFMEIAKEFNQTYVNLALSNSPEPVSTDSGEMSNAPDLNSSMHKRRLWAPGYRVNQCDVTTFLNVSSFEAGSSGSGSGSDSDTAPSTSRDVSSPPLKYIPLVSPPNSKPPRTTLPDQLPYQRVFKPLPTPIRSPFRCHVLSELHTMYPSVSDPSPLSSPSSYNPLLHQVTWRIRSVGNPMYLRLKALHTVIWKGGMVWEGRGRDTAFGGGRERVVGVAYDGIGRSSLCWEVKF